MRARDNGPFVDESPPAQHHETMPIHSHHLMSATTYIALNYGRKVILSHVGRHWIRDQISLISVLF